MRFGSAVGAGALGSLIATAPAMLRLDGAAGVCSPFGAWTLLIATTLLPMALLVLALQRARSGFLALGRRKDRGFLAPLFAWLASTFVALTCLGAFLRARTHHHALAGVTFAITGLALSLVLALVWTRLAAQMRRAPSAVQWATPIVLGTGFVGALAWALYASTRTATAPVLAMQRLRLVDGFAFVMGALIASRRPFVNRRALALLGPPLAAIALVLGVSSIRTCPSLCDVLSGQAPAVGWIVGLVGSN
jgi:hypothetical protein